MNVQEIRAKIAALKVDPVENPIVSTLELLDALAEKLDEIDRLTTSGRLRGVTIYHSRLG